MIGRNEGERLAVCLESIGRYDGPVVYADSGSSDGSPERAEQLGASVLRLDPSKPMNASRGRREGFDRLRQIDPGCEYVQFVDGDCCLMPGWVEEAVSFLDAHPHVAVVCGRRHEAQPEGSFYNRLCDEEWNTPVGEALASGGDAMMRSTAVDEVGGFDPTLMASEEPELAARLRAAGYQIWRIDVPMTEHDARIFSLRTYWRRSLRAGFGYVQAWKRSRGLPERTNSKLLQSAFFWVAGIPVIILMAALSLGEPALLLLIPGMYLLQITRMAWKRGALAFSNWRAAAIVFSVKWAEAAGAVMGLMQDGRQDAFEYKKR